MFCERCGTKVPKGAKFCEKCGASVEPKLQEHKEGVAHMKWILGGITGSIAVIAVVIVLFATSVLGGNKETIQTNTDGMQPDIGVSEPVTQSEVPTATPTIAPNPTPEPAESLMENVGGNAPEESMEEDNTDDSYIDKNLTVARTPEETYKQYIEAFVEAVNTGNANGLSQFLSGKVHKQQCDLVENNYKRGIREELQSCSVTSIKQVNDSRTKVNAKETIEVFYEDGSSKVVKQKYSYVCEYVDSMWVITDMKYIQ